MATKKPSVKPAVDIPPTGQIVFKLTDRARSQLHYLLVERSLTHPDERVTITGIILSAIGALARSKGWTDKG